MIFTTQAVANDKNSMDFVTKGVTGNFTQMWLLEYNLGSELNFSLLRSANDPSAAPGLLSHLNKYFISHSALSTLIASLSN